MSHFRWILPACLLIGATGWAPPAKGEAPEMIRRQSLDYLATLEVFGNPTPRSILKADVTKLPGGIETKRRAAEIAVILQHTDAIHGILRYLEELRADDQSLDPRARHMQVLNEFGLAAVPAIFGALEDTMPRDVSDESIQHLAAVILQAYTFSTRYSNDDLAIEIVVRRRRNERCRCIEWRDENFRRLLVAMESLQGIRAVHSPDKEASPGVSPTGRCWELMSELERCQSRDRQFQIVRQIEVLRRAGIDFLREEFHRDGPTSSRGTTPQRWPANQCYEVRAIELVDELILNFDKIWAGMYINWEGFRKAILVHGQAATRPIFETLENNPCERISDPCITHLAQVLISVHDDDLAMEFARRAAAHADAGNRQNLVRLRDEIVRLKANSGPREVDWFFIY